jgi:hypothetical protein
MTEWRVTYTVDMEARTPEIAAKKVADLLTKNHGRAAKRAVYEVRANGSFVVHTIDLDRPSRGGKNHFGDGDATEEG